MVIRFTYKLSHFQQIQCNRNEVQGFTNPKVENRSREFELPLDFVRLSPIVIHFLAFKLSNFGKSLKTADPIKIKDPGDDKRK